jgi:hypothetical protein
LIDKEKIKELKKGNGDTFLEISRAPDNAYIYLNWIGIQTLETVVMGGNMVLTMLRERPCLAVLNSNREIIGPWDVSINWITHKWIPQAITLGLEYHAHVLSPGIYGQRSYKKLRDELERNFKSESFENEEQAEDWIRMRHLERKLLKSNPI